MSDAGHGRANAAGAFDDDLAAEGERAVGSGAIVEGKNAVARDFQETLKAVDVVQGQAVEKLLHVGVGEDLGVFFILGVEEARAELRWGLRLVDLVNDDPGAEVLEGPGRSGGVDPPIGGFALHLAMGVEELFAGFAVNPEAVVFSGVDESSTVADFDAVDFEGPATAAVRHGLDTLLAAEPVGNLGVVGLVKADPFDVLAGAILILAFPLVVLRGAEAFGDVFHDTTVFQDDPSPVEVIAWRREIRTGDLEAVDGPAVPFS